MRRQLRSVSVESLLEISASSLENKLVHFRRTRADSKVGIMDALWSDRVFLGYRPGRAECIGRGVEGEGADQDGHFENRKCTQSELPRKVDSRTKGRY